MNTSSTSAFALGPLEIDALREAATIGGGHAATALSQLTNRTIRISVPRVQIMSAGELQQELETQGTDYLAVSMGMLGDVAGQTVQIFPRESARRLAAILLEADAEGASAELQQSTLCEVSNIIVGGYLDALSRLLSLLMFMSIPRVSIGRLGPLGGEWQAAETVLSFQTDLNLGEQHFAATFLFMPTEETVATMLRSLQLA